MSEFPRAVWLRSLRAALLRAPSDRLTYLGGHGIPELRLALATYLNFCEMGTDTARMFTPEAHARLREIKRAYDPQDVFQANHSIPPAGE